MTKWSFILLLVKINNEQNNKKIEIYKIFIFKLILDKRHKKIPLVKRSINDAILSFVSRVIDKIKIKYKNM